MAFWSKEVVLMRLKNRINLLNERDPGGNEKLIKKMMREVRKLEKE